MIEEGVFHLPIMSATLPVIPAASARLLFLGAQGLLASPERKVTRSVLQDLIEQIGFVQIDSINVVERAHHLTLASRLDSYQHEHLTHLLEKDRSLFEHWTHDASAIPTKWFSYWKPRFRYNRERIRLNGWWRRLIGDDPDRILNHVRERITREGPLRSQDFEHDRGGESSAWWGWKPQKAALEFLWSTGELMVSRRENFQKIYDLAERVFPTHHALTEPAEAEYVEWACSTALERLVIATPKEIADFWHAIKSAQAKQWCDEALRTRRIAPVIVQSSNGIKERPSFALVDWEERLRNLPDPLERIRLLCPFDPVLRDRARLQRLFGFDYRFEAFVPEPKRQYGYYVLPMIEGDRLVGRLDPKFHRARSVLEIRRVFWEPNIRETRVRRRKLDEATMRLARMIGAKRIEWAS